MQVLVDAEKPYKSRRFLNKIIMKNLVKKISLLLLLIIVSVVRGQNGAPTVDGGELENVTITCKNTSAGTATIYFGFISFTYQRFHLICNNGYEAFWTQFWW
jgi:hypothetical protein